MFNFSIPYGISNASLVLLIVGSVLSNYASATSPGNAEGRVYFGSYDKHVYCASISVGEKTGKIKSM